MPRMMLTGPWRAVVQSTNKLAAGTFGAAIDRAVAQEAMLMVQYVHEGFKNQGLHRKWAKLSPITLALRKGSGFGGSKPLHVSGSLKRSVTARRMGPAAWFVGVHRSARTSDGKSLVNIAAVHEGPFPTLIPCDAASEKGRKVRKFFLAMFLQGVIKAPLKKSRSILVIQQRPFLRPAFEKVKQDSQRRMIRRVRAYLRAQGVWLK